MAEFRRYFAVDHLPVGNYVNELVGDGSISGVQGAAVTIAVQDGRKQVRCGSNSYYDDATPGLSNLVVGLRTTLYGTNMGSFIDFRAGGASVVHVYHLGDGTMQVRQGSTVLGSAVSTIATQRYVEAHLRLSGAGADSLHLRADGKDELLLTGLTLGSAPITVVRRGVFTFSTDGYIREASAEGSPFHGPILMRLLRPQADVSVQWPRNGGDSNAGQLADPNGSDFDASTIETQQIGDTDEYTLEQLPPDVNSIIAVVPFTVSTAPAGGAPQRRLSLRTSGGTLLGPDLTVGVGGYRTQMHVEMEKPGGGGWSRAAVNELRLLPEAV